MPGVLPGSHADSCLSIYRHRFVSEKPGPKEAPRSFAYDWYWLVCSSSALLLPYIHPHVDAYTSTQAVWETRNRWPRTRCGISQQLPGCGHFVPEAKRDLRTLFFYRQYPIFACYSAETKAVARDARELSAILLVWTGKHDVYTEVGVRLPAARIIPQNKFPQQPWLQLRLLHKQGSH